MTIASILKQTTIDSIDAELMLCHILQVSRSYIKSHADHTLTSFEWARFRWLASKRKKHTPLAYLTGHKAFFGLDFEVNKHTLVPRPETELMVSLTLERIEDVRLKTKHLTLIDIGTGSGCIPISILSTIQNQLPISNLQCLASDISQKALRTAKRNAIKHNVDITFKQGSLFEPWSNGAMKQCNHIIITANLPYITEEQWEQEPSIQKEPKSALVAQEQGLALYRELLEQLNNPVFSLQSSIIIFLEIDPAQKESITPLIHTSLPNATVSVHDDLCDMARIVEIRIA